MKTRPLRFLCCLLFCLLAGSGCHRGPAVSTQELKSWSSNIEVRVLILESNQARFKP